MISMSSSNVNVDSTGANNSTSLSTVDMSSSNLHGTSNNLSLSKSICLSNQRIQHIKIKKHVEFEETRVNQTMVEHLLVGKHHTNEAIECKIVFKTQLCPPFFTKFTSKTLIIKSRSSVKIDIEFKPSDTGEYEQKIELLVNGYDLSCLVKGKCV